MYMGFAFMYKVSLLYKECYRYAQLYMGKWVSGNYNRSQALLQHLFRQGDTKVGVEAALELGVCKWRETGGNACTSCVHSATTTLEDRDSETTGHGWKSRGCLWVLYTVGRLVSQIMYVLYGDIFGMVISLWMFVGGSHPPLVS